MSEILEKLLGSKEKTRILRFFLLNPEKEFNFSEIVKKNMLNKNSVRNEINNLSTIKFLQKKNRKGKVSYALNQSFDYYPELKNLIAKSNVYPQCKSLAKLKKLGNVKFAAVSGIFINYSKAKADMILVGNGISRTKLKNFMKSLEAEIGKEVSFVLLGTDEMKYRLNMLDKFILEFLEGPHEELINKIPGLKQFIANRKN